MGSHLSNMKQGLCQEVLVEQVRNLQVNKLAMIVSYSSSTNLVVVMFLNKECFLLKVTFGVMFVHVLPQSL